MARRRHIRWDRVSIAAVILLLLILLLGSCIHSCGGIGDESSADPAGVSSAGGLDASQGNADIDHPDSTDSGNPAPMGYQEVTMIANAVRNGPLVLIDANHPCLQTTEELQLAKVYDAAEKPDTYGISYPGEAKLNKTALSQFNRMMKAYYTATKNTHIMFNYGYLKEGKAKSNPESAGGLDVQLHLKLSENSYSYIKNEKPYSWIFQNMASYGFILRYPEDKAEKTGQKGGYTAIRYVGTPHSMYMNENNLCLEEYLELLRSSYQFGQGILQYKTTELTYHVYFVPANETGDTSVSVPTTGTWEISGNNVDGFIVTAYTTN